jgi:hypothetical protein
MITAIFDDWLHTAGEFSIIIQAPRREALPIAVSSSITSLRTGTKRAMALDGSVPERKTGAHDAV